MIKRKNFIRRLILNTAHVYVVCGYNIYHFDSTYLNNCQEGKSQ